MAATPTNGGSSGEAESDRFGRGDRFRNEDLGRYYQITRDGDAIGYPGWSGHWLLREFRIERRRDGDDSEGSAMTGGDKIVRKTTSRVAKETLVERLDDGTYQPGWGRQTPTIEAQSSELSERD